MWPGAHCTDLCICRDPIMGNESTLPESQVIQGNVTTAHPTAACRRDWHFLPPLSLNFTRQKQKSTIKKFHFFKETKTYWVRDTREIILLFLLGLLMSPFESSLEWIREFICLEGRMEGEKFVLFSRKSSAAWMSLTTSRIREKKQIYGNAKFPCHENKS